MEAKQDGGETLKELMAERDCLDPSFVHATRLLTEEIKRVEDGDKSIDGAGDGKKGDVRLLDVTSGKPIKLCVKITIPVKEHPKFNFVGKLLGPRGNSLKRLQEETGTKIAILGKGSMRDKDKETKLREENNQKYAHLSEELHVQIDVLGIAGDAYYRLAHAIGEVQKYLIPDPNDDIRQEQLRELAYISGSYSGPPQGLTGSRGGGRVLLPRGGGPGGMQRGGWGGSPQMRGGMAPPAVRPSMSGAPARMGSPPGRGMSRGGPSAPRGAPSRGGPRGAYRGGAGGPRMGAPSSYGSQSLDAGQDYYEGGYDHSYNQGYDESNTVGPGAYKEYGAAGDGYAETGYGGVTETEAWDAPVHGGPPGPQGPPPARLKFPSAMQQRETLRAHPYNRF